MLKQHAAAIRQSERSDDGQEQLDGPLSPPCKNLRDHSAPASSQSRRSIIDAQTTRSQPRSSSLPLEAADSAISHNLPSLSPEEDQLDDDASMAAASSDEDDTMPVVALAPVARGHKRQTRKDGKQSEMPQSKQSDGAAAEEPQQSRVDSRDTRHIDADEVGGTLLSSQSSTASQPIDATFNHMVDTQQPALVGPSGTRIMPTASPALFPPGTSLPIGAAEQHDRRDTHARERSVSVMPADFEDLIPAPLETLDLAAIEAECEELSEHYDALLAGEWSGLNVDSRLTNELQAS